MRKKFKFNLERILDLRGMQENLRKMEFGRAQARVIEAENKKTRLEKQYEGADRDLGELRSLSPMPIEQCVQAETVLILLRRSIETQGTVIEDLIRQAETAKQAYVEAMKKRKALTMLKDKRMAQHRREAFKKELKMFDEIAARRAQVGG